MTERSIVIKVKESTAKELQGLANFGDTYDSIIKRLIRGNIKRPALREKAETEELVDEINEKQGEPVISKGIHKQPIGVPSKPSAKQKKEWKEFKSGQRDT